MFGIHDYWLFVGAGILLNLTPGQDTFYILGRSLAHGRAVGVASALGVSAGGLIHRLAAALGLSAILATSASAFTALKLIGAAYLIYLGVSMLLTRPRTQTTRQESAVTTTSAFRQGMITNVTNPKVALFFLAFLPQFIDAASPTKIAAFIALGFTFLLTGTVWGLVLAATAARVRDFAEGRSREMRWLPRITGGLFVFLGLRLATSRT